MQDYKPKERKYFSDDGRPYSFNDPKYIFFISAGNFCFLALRIVKILAKVFFCSENELNKFE